MSPDFRADQSPSNQETGKAGRLVLIRRLEWIVAIALSTVTLFLLVVRATHAGALWRDEAESAQSAGLPIAEMFKYFRSTSFPILFPLSVRAYATLFGTTDIGLRCFGLAVGVLLLGIAWVPFRRLTGDFPLLLMAIIGLNTNLLVVGTSLRGYGLGSILVVLALAFTIRLLLNPGAPSLAWVFVAYLASAQCLFFNSALLMAIVIAATAVLLIRRNVKTIWFLMGIAIVSGLSYIPYLVSFVGGTGPGGRILNPILLSLVWQPFKDAWGGISTGVSTVWLSVIFLLLMEGVWGLANIWSKHRTRDRDLLLFGMILIPVSMITYYAFMRVLPRRPEQRYFLALTCLVAASADLLWASLPRPYWLRAARIGLVLLATIWLPFAIWPKLVQAESNAHVIAEKVEKSIRPGDLIVINPWSLGISFNWYYHGTTPWMTVPELNDHRVHRYDLLFKKMASAAPLQDVEEEITATLKSGNRVWFVGQAELPAPGGAPVALAPAPDPRFGWSIEAYRRAWSQGITIFLLGHIKRANVVPVPTGQLISERENMMLYLLEGWEN